MGTLRENQCFGDAAIPKLTTERMKEELGDVNLHLHHANKGIRAATVTAISDKVKVLCLSTISINYIAPIVAYCIYCLGLLESYDSREDNKRKIN